MQFLQKAPQAFLHSETQTGLGHDAWGHLNSEISEGKLRNAKSVLPQQNGAACLERELKQEGRALPPATQNFLPVYTFANEPKSNRSTDLGAKNKSEQVGKLTNTEPSNNKDQLY